MFDCDLSPETMTADMAHRTPNKSRNENGSDQRMLPEMVGRMNPKEYTVEQREVFPLASAMV